ncbi:hypothetical protein CNY89_14020 [Amaricoccus sp. HAR-UPW-R2A-40]|nr:hypothetical protein CNY89_14020 [Amaricoccus sp. HAR-UPW-R2A-40]
MDRIVEPLAIIVICLGALWLMAVAHWFGHSAVVAVLLTAFVGGLVAGVIELVRALIDRAAVRPVEGEARE